jgi:hypothetical protein
MPNLDYAGTDVVEQRADNDRVAVNRNVRAEIILFAASDAVSFCCNVQLEPLLVKTYAAPSLMTRRIDGIEAVERHADDCRLTVQSNAVTKKLAGAPSGAYSFAVGGIASGEVKKRSHSDRAPRGELLSSHPSANHTAFFARAARPSQRRANSPLHPALLPDYQSLPAKTRKTTKRKYITPPHKIFICFSSQNASERNQFYLHNF